MLMDFLGRKYGLQAADFQDEAVWGRNMVGGQVSYRPLRYSSHGVQMYRIPIHNKIRYTVKAQLLLSMNGSCAF